MNEDLLRRAEDLARQCERGGTVAHSRFLTPAERYALEQWAGRSGAAVRFDGGFANAERRAAFFLPDWMEPEQFDPAEWLRALAFTARFGAPGHRDCLGAALALGVERPWLGDILIEGETAYLVCLPSVKEHLLLNLDHIGRWGVKGREIPLSGLPAIRQELRERSFSVQSLRLDAVCAGMFSLSRSAAAQAIAEGLVSLNYAPCARADAPVAAGDVISLRGKGKGEVLSAGDRASKKGRLFVTTGVRIYSMFP